jgi:demethylmenaquinone methyltransferase/2-methoxy-6-polyprenyl-1,4-benzoquinol methylase
MPTTIDAAASPSIYSPAYVQNLFTEMSATYGLINLITSFGFSARWRKQCAAAVVYQPGDVVVDLMSGMGELWPDIAVKLVGGSLTGVDFCQAMCERSRQRASSLPDRPVRILQRDALESGIPDGSVDIVLSSFGLKTFTAEQRAILAREIARMLRPGGRFALLEISVPRSLPMRVPYMFYLKFIIPLLGWLLMGNPNNYRMLGIYTAAFGDCTDFALSCRESGLKVEMRQLFFACATIVVGMKRAD